MMWKGRARLSPVIQAVPLLRQSSTVSQATRGWTIHPANADVAKDQVAQLAASPRRALKMADLLRWVANSIERATNRPY